MPKYLVRRILETEREADDDRCAENLPQFLDDLDYEMTTDEVERID